MHGPDWAWALLMGIMLGGLALTIAGLVFLLWRTWRRPAAWWRWPALALIAWFLLAAVISLGQLVAEPIGVEAGNASVYAFGVSFLVLMMTGLLSLLWRVGRHKTTWWRWPALAIIAWFLLSMGAALGTVVAELI